jgi:hypothetical protein
MAFGITFGKQSFADSKLVTCGGPINTGTPVSQGARIYGRKLFSIV